MNGLISLIFISAIIGMSCAIVCTPDFCSLVRCAGVNQLECEANGNAVYEPHGGTCGCCALCVHLINEGESCVASLLEGGVARTSRCADGLACSSETHTCVKQSF